jgi:hypothetical protein
MHDAPENSSSVVFGESLEDTEKRCQCMIGHAAVPQLSEQVTEWQPMPMRGLEALDVAKYVVNVSRHRQSG